MSAGLPKNDPAEIPAGIPSKPDPKNFLPPVAWLFGRQLLANIKWFALYAAFKGKLDPRDWMKPNIIRANQSDKPLDESGSPKEAAEDEAYWFDYIADTGDGQKAVYTIAYLCMSDLALTKSQPGAEVGFVLDARAARLKTDDQLLLPRGAAHWNSRESRLLRCTGRVQSAVSQTCSKRSGAGGSPATAADDSHIQTGAGGQLPRSSSPLRLVVLGSGYRRRRNGFSSAGVLQKYPGAVWAQAANRRHTGTHDGIR